MNPVLFAVRTRVQDLVVGDRLVYSVNPVTPGWMVTAIRVAQDGSTAEVWYDSDPDPFDYDPRFGLVVVRSREGVVRDLARVCLL